MVAQCLPKIISGVDVELKAGGAGPVKSSVWPRAAGNGEKGVPFVEDRGICV